MEACKEKQDYYFVLSPNEIRLLKLGVLENRLKDKESEADFGKWVRLKIGERLGWDCSVGIFPYGSEWAKAEGVEVKIMDYLFEALEEGGTIEGHYVQGNLAGSVSLSPDN